MHATVDRMMAVVAAGREEDIAGLLAEDVRFQPPTYWKTWTGREAVAALLGHVGRVFTNFRYRRVMGDGDDWALEFQCKVGALDAVGVDLITLNDAGLIRDFEVVMRPLKSVEALRAAMNQSVAADPRFAAFHAGLS